MCSHTAPLFISALVPNAGTIALIGVPASIGNLPLRYSISKISSSRTACLKRCGLSIQEMKEYLNLCLQDNLRLLLERKY